MESPRSVRQELIFTELEMDSREYSRFILETSLGGRFTASYYILTAGTFLNGRIFVGDRTAEGGRVAEPSSHLISSQLCDQGIQTSRMKTGTPPRIDVRSVNLSRLILQSGDESPEKFSYLPYLSAAQRQDIQDNRNRTPILSKY